MKYSYCVISGIHLVLLFFFFSLSLIQTVYPGFVATAMSGIRRPKFWAPSPETYAKSAVATIGVQQDTYGYLFHAVQVINIPYYCPSKNILSLSLSLSLSLAHEGTHFDNAS